MGGCWISGDHAELAGNRLFPAAFLGRVVAQGIDFAKAGSIPVDQGKTPEHRVSGDFDALIPISTLRPGSYRLDMVYHAVADETVREEERMTVKVGWSAERTGEVGIDGDNSVAGREGFHDVC